MYFDRLLKYINTLIVILALLALGGVYWFAWRPLPQTSGTIQGGVAQKVTVSFDGLGEPHIAAASQEDTVTASGRKVEWGQGVVILFDQERSLEFEQYSDDLDVSSFAASWVSPARGETVPREQ